MDYKWVSLIVNGLVILFSIGISFSLNRRRSEDERTKRDIGSLYDRTEKNCNKVSVLEERLKNHKEQCDHKHH